MGGECGWWMECGAGFVSEDWAREASSWLGFREAGVGMARELGSGLAFMENLSDLSQGS